ncbi:MAG: tail fiber domain-containing protein [Bacteroidales bacterium]|nr:tail fiber domain-containing protein [Bacteroidales bacterium]
MKIASHSYITSAGTFRPLSSTNSNYLGSGSFQFNGIYGKNIWANGSYLGSDLRFKENFRDIESPLEKLLQLKGLKYDLKGEAVDTTSSQKEKEKNERLRKNKMGFVAQDVMELFPEAVVYEEDIDRYYLDYTAIIPVIVEAMKEQQATIGRLEEALSACANANKDKSATLQDGETKPALLFQNVPNPFNRTTRIGLYLPNAVTAAALYIYTLQGEQVMSVPVRERGSTFATIEGNTLKAGMYLYALVADGKEVDTKKMILTK